MSSPAKTRLRKVACSDCGYTARICRSWLAVGLPGCPCGGTLEPESPADRAFAGLIGPADVSLAEWNQIARENGWEIMRNHGQHARSRPVGASVLHEVRGAAHCQFAGCGRWVADGADFCSAGHAQHDGLADAVEPVEAIPF